MSALGVRCVLENALWLRPEITVLGQAKRTFDPLSIDGTAHFRSKPRS